MLDIEIKYDKKNGDIYAVIGDEKQDITGINVYLHRL